MKKIATIYLLLISALSQLKAQQSVLFNMKYMPNRTYTSTMKMDMNMEMTMTGDSTVMEQMKNSDQKFPMIMQMQTATDLGIKTGAISANRFPINMTIDVTGSKMKMNGVEQTIPMPADAKQNISGECTLDGKLSFESVTGTKVGDSVKQQLTKVIEMIQNGIIFPDKPMKVGDTFTQDMPVDIPLAGNTSKMMAKAVYKLIAIENKKAYFDVVFDMDMKLANTMDMKGGGSGKLVYDMVNNFQTTMQETMKVDYSMTLPQMPPSMKMGGKMNMLIDQTTVISGN